jgi:hypothetical protein
LIDSLPKNSRAFSKRFQFAKTASCSFGKVNLIWFTPTSNYLVSSEEQAARLFLAHANVVNHHGKSWLFQLRASWEKTVYKNHASLTAAQQAIAQANGGGNDGGIARGNGCGVPVGVTGGNNSGVAGGNDGVASGNGGRKAIGNAGGKRGGWKSHWQFWKDSGLIQLSWKSAGVQVKTKNSYASSRK